MTALQARVMLSTRRGVERKRARKVAIATSAEYRRVVELARATHTGEELEAVICDLLASELEELKRRGE